MAGIERLRERAQADAALRLLPTITDAPLHLVGGVVRDALRGVHTGTDWDIAVPTDAIDLARQWADAVGGVFVSLHETHATARVVGGTSQYDLAAYRAPTLEGDLPARDFTINAIAVELRALLAGGDVPLIDPCGGVRDLESSLLRPCGPGVFAADPVRAMRLYRFVATLGFAPTTEADAQATAVLSRGDDDGHRWWRSVAPERVTDELAQIFVGPAAAADAITRLADAGVLDAFVPHWAETRGLAQGRNHDLDVFGHDVHAAAIVAGHFLPRLDAWVNPHADALRQWLDVPVGGGRTRRWLVPFAALIHDVGKAVTCTIKPNGRPDFSGHEIAGGHIAAQVAANLRLSRAERKLLVACVRLHGYPNALQRHGPDHPLRFFAVAGEAAPGVILVATGDRATANGPARPPEKVARDVTFLLRHARDYFGIWAPLLATPPLVRGDEVMAALGLAPGKRVAELLLLLRRRQLAGVLASRDAAIDAAPVVFAARHGIEDPSNE